jgi:hypothetical protein
MALVRIADPLATCLIAVLALTVGGCGRFGSSQAPLTVTTCALLDGGSKYDGAQVAVQAVIRTDLMHFQNIESPGCAHRPVAMYFATDSKFNPCGNNTFAKQLQCPLNALDYRIDAMFIGTYHSADKALEVKELKDFKRTKQGSIS